MVFCAAVGCCSRSGKSQDTSFYRLSKMVTKIEDRQFAIKKKSESVTFNLKMNVSNKIWRYLIICCERFLNPASFS